MGNVLKERKIGRLTVQIGSDHHYPLYLVYRYLERLLYERRADYLFLLGDIFLTEDEDASAQINYVIGELARYYSMIFYTPGNHCLRGRNNPWQSFSLPANVVYPKDPFDTPVTVVRGVKILVGNLFYDQNFIEPGLIGFTPEDVARFYRNEVNDGKHFLGGDTSLFSKMTTRLARSLDDSIDVLATHGLPHPSLVTFRVPELTDEILALAQESGIPFICDPVDDQIQADREGVSIQDFRRYWNLKSFIMGSNVLTNEAANFKDGLIALYGHNHRGEYSKKTIRGKRVLFDSHQTPFR